MKTFAALFSGGGGVDVGLMAAGLSPLWGVEYDADIARVYRQNIGDHVIVADVRSVDYAALPHADWLHASPVCTNASVANPNGRESETDIETAQAVVRAIKEQSPQVFTLENVWGYRDYAAFRLILNALADGGYFYDFEHVNCADFGVPQTRKRLILRSSRGLLPALPQPVPWVGWYAAIEDLIPTLPDSQLAPWQLERLPGDLREAVLISNAKTEYGDGMAQAGAPAWSVTSNVLRRSRAVLVESRNTNQQYGDGRRLADEPATTVTTDGKPSHAPRAILVPGILNGESQRMTTRDGCDPSSTVTVHQRDIRAVLPTRTVAMTPRCLARFQSVPDWYQLPAKRTLAAKIIGNMVPPPVMQKIAENMLGGDW